MRARFIYKRNNYTRPGNKFKFIALTLFKNFTDSFSRRGKLRFSVIKIKIQAIYTSAELLIFKYSIKMKFV